MKEQTAPFTCSIRNIFEQQCLREMEEELLQLNSYHANRNFQFRGWLKRISLLVIYLSTMICVGADPVKSMQGMSFDVSSRK